MDDDDDSEEESFNTDGDEEVIQKWNCTETEVPDEETVKVMITLALVEGVRTVFVNHIYSFKGQFYLQIDQGPIGLRLIAEYQVWRFLVHAGHGTDHSFL